MVQSFVFPFPPGPPVKRLSAAILGVILVVVPRPLISQDVRSSAESGRRVAVENSLGVVSYGTGNDANCGTGVGFGAGRAVRTVGTWVLGLSGDILLAGPLVCTTMLLGAWHDGELVEAWSGVSFAGAPRLGFQAGRVIRQDGAVEMMISGGIVGGRNQVGRNQKRLWRPWFAGAATVRVEHVPFGIRIEYGYHAVPMHYIRDHVVVHEFDRWKPMIRLSSVF